MNSFKNIGTILLLLLFSKASGQNIIIRPYLQDLGNHKVSILWEADASGPGQVIWGSTPFQLDSLANSQAVSINGSSWVHTCTINQLKSNSKYYYRIQMQGGQQSFVYHFKTLPLAEDNAPIQLVAISDMQRDNSQPDKFREIIEEGIIPLVQQEIGNDLSDLEGILIAGDLVVTGGNYGQWRNHFFNPSDSLSPYVPIYPVPGNHEYFSGGLPNFKHYFDLPDNGPASLHDECWFKDISNVRILGLNSNSGTQDQNLQLNWLSSILDSTCMESDIDFVFAELHHPFKSELWTPGENDFTGKVIDSLERFSSLCNKASIHFFGHTHGYSRGQSRDHKHLWINVATAGGAIDNWGEFPNADYEEFVKSQDEYGFVYIDVEAGSDPSFSIKRFGRGDQDFIQNNVLRDKIQVFNEDQRPFTPIAIYPDEDTLANRCVTLKASDFSGIEDSIQASHWQVGTDSTFHQGIVEEQWWQGENYYNEVNWQATDDLSDIDLNTSLLPERYYWRVRYRNQNLTWSQWSMPKTFVIEEASDTISANLLLNPNAENMTFNWSGDIEALVNGQCNSVAPFEGQANFGVGGICSNESPQGLAFQSIDLSNFQSEINTDTTSLLFGGYLRNYSGSDLPEIYIELYAQSTLVATSPLLSYSGDFWTELSGVEAVPPGVDSCVFYLKGTRNAGNDNDSYFDALFLYLIDRPYCRNCFGNTNRDRDEDGFCNDIDCNDLNPAIYPGALEVCDSIDNNCDGIVDSGPIVRWTGQGNSSKWEEPANWDQNMPPLPCQHVIIEGSALVEIDSLHLCKSMEIQSGSQVTIHPSASLHVYNQDLNFASIQVQGGLLINGTCEVKSSSSIAFDVSGTLINNNRINTEEINAASVRLRGGGSFQNLGESIFK
jgi:hypothetical protein